VIRIMRHSFERPEYIHARPQLHIDFPEREKDLKIPNSNLPFTDDYILNFSQYIGMRNIYEHMI
jgi:hypothetical protein